MGTGSFLRVKSGRGVTLAPHSILVPWSWKGITIPLLPLWAVRPEQSLSACTRMTFTFLLLPARKSDLFYCLIVLSSVACLPLVNFSKPSYERRDLRGKNVANTKCIFWFSLQRLSEIFLIQRRTERDMNSRYIKCRLFLSNKKKLEFSGQIFEKIIKHFHENPFSGNRMFHADRQTDRRTDGRTDRRTDMTKLIFAFSYFEKKKHLKTLNIGRIQCIYFS